MPYKEGQPTLIGFLGIPAVTKVAKTRLLGGTYIHFGGFLVVCSYLYESGAILGYARNDKLTTLARLFPADIGKEDIFISELQNTARERLQEYKEEFRKEPNSFWEFIYLLELKKLGLSITNTDLKTLEKATLEKCSLNQAEPFIKMSGLEGIGFGSTFPELTKKMYRNYHENINMDVWTRARAVGLSIPEKPTKISLEEQEDIILQMVAVYSSEYYPELLDPLDLRSYLDVGSDC